MTTFSSLNQLTNRFRRVHWHIENSNKMKIKKRGRRGMICTHTWLLAVVWILHYHLSRSSAASATRTSLTPIKLPSVPMRMLVLSIQLPSRHFAVTRDRFEISYSCLVGRLGRIRSHSHGNRRSAATENYDYAIVRPGASHIMFRLARSIIVAGSLNATSQRQRRPNFAISLPLPQNLSG